MKQSNFFSAGAVALAILFSACNSGGDEKATDKTTTTDTTAQQKPPETPQAPRMTMLIKHKVANFDKWLPLYEGHDSARVAYGLHNFVVSRGIKDSNMVMIALHMDDTAKAKQFSMLPDLKTTMQKAGVIGAPMMMYTVSAWYDSTTNSSTTRVMINQKVKDWDTWKKAFDGHKQARMDAGLTDRAVSRGVGDPNMVSVVLAVSDMKKAEDFMKSKDLKDKMTEGGVVGAPDIWFYHVVKQW